MNFLISKSFNLNQGEPVYYLEENSFSFEPFLDTDISILIDKAYLGLDIDLKDNKIYSLSGYSPKNSWHVTALVSPSIIIKGNLIYYDHNNWHTGEGARYSEWEIFFDPKTNWICVGNNQIKSTNKYVEFLNNCIASIHDDVLEAVYIHPKFL